MRPWHPPLVHFPIACWMLATGADGAAFIAQLRGAETPLPFAAAELLLWTGLASAVAAASAGALDLARLPGSARASRELARHVVWMGAAAVLFLAAALLHLQRDGPLDWATVAVELAGSLTLVVGGHYAAVVVFERLPEAIGASAADHPSS